MENSSSSLESISSPGLSVVDGKDGSCKENKFMEEGMKSPFEWSERTEYTFELGMKPFVKSE